MAQPPSGGRQRVVCFQRGRCEQGLQRGAVGLRGCAGGLEFCHTRWGGADAEVDGCAGDAADVECVGLGCGAVVGDDQCVPGAAFGCQCLKGECVGCVAVGAGAALAYPGADALGAAQACVCPECPGRWVDFGFACGGCEIKQRHDGHTCVVVRSADVQCWVLHEGEHAAGE